MKIKRKEAVNLFNSFGRLGSHKGVKFAYAIAKNKKKLESEQKAITVAQSKIQPKAIQEFDKKRIKVCCEYADKDENGNPKLDKNNYSISEERRIEFDKAIDELQKEYEPSFKEMENNQKEFNDFLDEDIEVDLHLIPMSVVPDTITVNEMDIIFPMIVEEE